MANFQSGFPLFFQQYRSLLKKNSILTWRSKRSAFLQLFSSLFFLLLIFGIDRALRAQMKTRTSYRNVLDPPAIVSPPIPACEEKFYIEKPCFDFVWSGSGNNVIEGIVSGIMKNNPGRVIGRDRVKSFRTPDEVDTWLFKNPMRCPGALHFVQKNLTVISYGIQTNSTEVPKRGQYEDPTFKFQIPLQVAAEREIARYLIGDPSFSWTVGFKEFPHPATETFSTIGNTGQTFFLAIAMFGFVFQISSLVTEKELKLRQVMSMMGLYDSAYWLSWLTWEAILTFVSSLVTVLFGMMFQFDFFLHNSFLVLFFVFYLFQLAMLGFALMLSAFISKASSATTAGFSVFIIGFLTQTVTVFGFPYADSYKPLYRIIWSLFPPNLLAQALHLLGDATSTPGSKGISWANRGKCDSTDSCIMTIDGVLRWSIATFVLWTVLALYLDNIIPNSNGVRKSIIYFLFPSYWTGNGGNKVEGSICSCMASVPHIREVTADDEDVLAEETAVKRQLSENINDSNTAVQILGLRKTYPGTTSFRCCCRCRRTSPYHAVKGIWVNLVKNQLFCLLGSNGAGKTTVINCLTGITPVTGGDALIYGYSVCSSTGMSNIRRMIGVCPQFDILWDALSAQEHLHLFSNIKGLPPSTIKAAAEKSIAEVKLTHAAKVRAGSYSGGMKRRLSVAIALIGDPKLVFLDEPTTGMDPISRRHVWDIIEEAKKGRAIILTTHSMEEADILSDRIAIMAKGRLRCLGTSIRLKSRFGTGYIATVSFQVQTLNGGSGGDATTTSESHTKTVKQFFKNHLNIEPKEENKSFLTFVIPRDKEGQLTDFFAELQDREKEFGISDIQLGLTTLEEVFLSIAKQAEIESSAAEGRLVTLNLSSGTSIEIPKGARFIGIPETESADNTRGTMVEVYWEQDDSGNLCISGHSDPIPVPPNVQIGEHSRASRSSARIGYVIDPDQIINTEPNR